MKKLLLSLSLLVLSWPSFSQVSCSRDALGNYICKPGTQAAPARPNAGIGAAVGVSSGSGAAGNPFGGSGASSPGGSFPTAGSGLVSQREEITNPVTDRRKVLHPEGLSSASVQFNTGQVSSGMFSLCSSTSYRIPDGNTTSISTTPGDFTTPPPECVHENFAENGVMTFITRDRYVSGDRNMGGVCVLEPGRTYYFNVRFTNRSGTVSLCPRGNCGVYVDLM